MEELTDREKELVICKLRAAVKEEGLLPDEIQFREDTLEKFTKHQKWVLTNIINEIKKEKELNNR